MASETRSKGVKVETKIAPSLKKRLMAKVRKNKTSVAQVLRDYIQSWAKG